MSRIDLVQGNRKLIEVNVLVLPVELTSTYSPSWQRKRGTTTTQSSMSLLLACLRPLKKQGMNVTVGTVARKNTLINMPFV